MPRSADVAQTNDEIAKRKHPHASFQAAGLFQPHLKASIGRAFKASASVPLRSNATPFSSTLADGRERRRLLAGHTLDPVGHRDPRRQLRLCMKSQRDVIRLPTDRRELEEEPAHERVLPKST
ncbi:hypothetical protein LB577_21605 [Mesorhizobium sp. B283B1A]|uniref:hypothetical protein n=1 Tax=Mesorhizobium TaxID=68287 RepID=UPI001CD04EED|nr:MULTISPECIES: hypothetical protein [Mesorhizobium]MCA0049506.1 hypothetical protein [Mesorhizobium sp. B283B1A]UQS63747.1 hypothetical protein M5D98_27110 [Mesorhizobium opportunistum]